jgi:hypothetical protein
MKCREEELWSLKAEVENAGSAPKRSSYVHRISELVRNSQKQANDITRIIQDTRNLQRENNSAHDRLRRVHALVDELVFRSLPLSSTCVGTCASRVRSTMIYSLSVSVPKKKLPCSSLNLDRNWKSVVSGWMGPGNVAFCSLSDQFCCLLRVITLPSQQFSKTSRV